jgi:amino acid transporter
MFSSGEDLMASWKRFLIGAPLSSDRAHEEKLNRPKALAIFASDALSSVAYATEEILLRLVAVGSLALSVSVPIAGAIIGLLWLLIISYRQTILKYPQGGGAYNVSKDNLGITAGLVAGSSLLVDYVLTVSVSVAAGISAIIAAAPTLEPYRVTLNVVAIVLIGIVNLRGIRESGSAFAIPPYLFIGGLILLIVVGMYQLLVNGRPLQPEEVRVLEPKQDLNLFLILTAFAGGCTALTGVEAISNGVPSFKAPAALNARATLATLGILATLLFGGITFLAEQLHVVPDEGGTRTVLSIIAGEVFGSGSVGFWFIQIMTMSILVLAANTAFNGFPLLASLMARDNFLPRQFTHVGDRLVYSNGIIILAVAAAALNVVFAGKVTNLIPLYAIGVFTSFSLSQAGMVKRWLNLREPGWQAGLAISGLGGIVSFIVLCVFAVTKFSEGAWIVLILIPLLIFALNSIRRHYASTAEQLSLVGRNPSSLRRNHVIVPVGTLHRGVVRALEYARTLSTDVTAVYVETSPETTQKLRAKWEIWGQGIPLEVLDSPYRSTVQPLMSVINRYDNSRRDTVVTIVIPEFVPHRWWQQILHNQTALTLKFLLLSRRNTVVISVPFHLDD